MADTLLMNDNINIMDDDVDMFERANMKYHRAMKRRRQAMAHTSHPQKSQVSRRVYNDADEQYEAYMKHGIEVFNTEEEMEF
ncbi:MAG: hypothetical protein K6F69_08140 [Treponema sp.]|nr:hypothetical protein [Treponema sp.]